jgi:hypothetical protein
MPTPQAPWPTGPRWAALGAVWEGSGSSKNGSGSGSYEGVAPLQEPVLFYKSFGKNQLLVYAVLIIINVEYLEITVVLSVV